MIFLNDNSAWVSLLIAIVPSYLSYNAGKKKVTVEKEGSAASQWQELYNAMEKDRDGWKSSSQEQQKQIDDLKNVVRDLQSDINKIKNSYEDRIERLEADLDELEEEKNYMVSEIERLEAENLDLKRGLLKIEKDKK